MKQDVLLLVDGGADDAALLLSLLGDEDTNITGIVCNHGNIGALKCVSLMKQILTLAGRTDIPVAVGSKRALRSDWNPMGDGAYGEDGINGVRFPKAVFKRKTTPGPEFIVRQLKQAQDAGKKLVLMVSSPMTVLAQALDIMDRAQSSGLLKAIETVYAFGGCFEPVPRRKEFMPFDKPVQYNSPGDPGLFHWEQGNITPWAEFNVYMDPEAWAMCMHRLAMRQVKTRIMDLATGNGYAIKARTSLMMTLERLDMIGKRLPHGADLAVAFDAAAGLDVRKLGAEGALLYDPLLVEAYKHPEWFAAIPITPHVVTNGDMRGHTKGFASSGAELSESHSIVRLEHNSHPDMLFESMVSRMAKALTLSR